MEKLEKSIDECISNIQEFADRFELEFVKNGTCGFGRECVGLLDYTGRNYIDYNPTQAPDYEYIKRLYDVRLYNIIPPKAYRKHDCIVVLGTDDDSIRQLSDWVDKLKELGVTIERYHTGDTGLQAEFTGTHRYAVRVQQ